jgi:hypothetical protein
MQPSTGCHCKNLPNSHSPHSSTDKSNSQKTTSIILLVQNKSMSDVVLQWPITNIIKAKIELVSGTFTVPGNTVVLLCPEIAGGQIRCQSAIGVESATLGWGPSMKLPAISWVQPFPLPTISNRLQSEWFEYKPRPNDVKNGLIRLNLSLVDAASGAMAQVLTPLVWKLTAKHLYSIFE